MSSVLSKELVEKVIEFHGHKCPGLALGIRAAEIALNEIGSHSKDEEVVAIVETDMCGVDAIQVLTGCTFGKGNLVFLDHGKVAFSFFNRANNKKLRIKINPKFSLIRDDMDKRYNEIMSSDLSALYLREEPPFEIPNKARIMDSFICSSCEEKTK